MTLKCLELGTGQFPIVPIYYYLHGINYIYSIDVVPFLTIDRIKNTIEYFIAFEKDNPERFKYYLSEVIPERWQELLSWPNKRNEHSTVEEVISQFKTTVVIQDARKTDFKEGEFDFITSNNTFEHIYPEILEGILKEFYRILSPGGVMSHFIDMTDHFAHFDNKINVYNYLKFSPGVWTLIDNEILPQSRLRLKDYKKMYNKLNIPINDTVIWEHNPELVKQVNVHACWKDYTIEELAIVHVYLVSIKN